MPTIRLFVAAGFAAGWVCSRLLALPDVLSGAMFALVIVAQWSVSVFLHPRQ